MPKIIIGVMGAGNSGTPKDMDNAYRLGLLIAENHWVLLTGGRNIGVMDAASRGAKSAGGLTVGILPGKNLDGVSEALDLAIVTDLGNARNNLNVLSSQVVIACGMGAGTASEIALAIKNGKPVILLNEDRISRQFFTSLAPEQIAIAETPETAIALTREILAAQSMTSS
jgi:hypothetical protein